VRPLNKLIEICLHSIGKDSSVGRLVDDTRVLSVSKDSYGDSVLSNSRTH